MILNEELYARSLLLGKNTEVKSAVDKIGYITRYNFHVLRKDDNDNYEDTVRWMQKHQDNFVESFYSNVISNAIKYAKKKPFFIIDRIKISKTELEKIRSLNNLRAEKVLFVLLCMAKQQSVSLGFTNGLVRYKITELCKMARISVPAEDREYILYNILQSGLISSPKKNNTNCLIVNFIDDGDPELMLTEADCKELAYVYLKWKGNGKFKRCSSCNRLIRNKNNDAKCTYCKQQNIYDKVIWCIDCGEEVSISEKDTRTCRCAKCQNKSTLAKYSKYNAKRNDGSTTEQKKHSTKLMQKI